MRIAIVGAGGVGGLLAGLLSRSGTEVSLLARGEQLRAIRDKGLRIEAPSGTFEARPAEVSDDPAALGPADVVLVAVKTWQLAAVAPRIAPLLARSTIAVPLENGVDAAEVLGSALGPERVAGGLCHMIAFVPAPGVVRQAAPMLSVTPGELQPGQKPALERLCQVLRQAGVAAEVTPDVRSALWEKLLFVEPFGSVGAVARSPIGVVRQNPETRVILERAMREVELVARAQGIAVRAEAVPASLKRIDALPADGTSSLHRDLVAGRVSELHELTGAVVRRGRATGTPTPVHEVLYAALLPQEDEARRSAGFA